MHKPTSKYVQETNKVIGGVGIGKMRERMREIFRSNLVLSHFNIIWLKGHIYMCVCVCRVTDEEAVLGEQYFPCHKITIDEQLFSLCILLYLP